MGLSIFKVAHLIFSCLSKKGLSSGKPPMLLIYKNGTSSIKNEAYQINPHSHYHRELEQAPYENCFAGLKIELIGTSVLV